jgi:hypothetical protein
MTRKPENPLDNSVLREVRAARRELWAEAQKTPGGMPELARRTLDTLGIKPREAKPTKPAKRRRPAS